MICIILISPIGILLLSLVVFLYLISQMCSWLGQMLTSLLESVQHLLLLLKFALMLSAHIALMLELYLQRMDMDTLKGLT